MSDESIKSVLNEQRRFAPNDAFAKNARVKSREDYERLYRESLDDPESFWRRETSELVFRKTWTVTSSTKDGARPASFPHVRWFEDAELNITESCLDRHLTGPRRNKAALLWEGEMGGSREIASRSTWAWCPRRSWRCSRARARRRAHRGLRRLRADALRDRINDCGEARPHAGRRLAPRQVLPLKDGRRSRARAARGEERREGHRLPRTSASEAPVHMKEGRDLWWHEVARDSTKGPPKEADGVDAEHPLFILYTSGSTGKPKGVCTRPRATSPARTSRRSTSSISARTTSTGAPPTSAGSPATATSSTARSRTARPAHVRGRAELPGLGRFWRIIEKHGVTILYTAPTAIRAFIRAGRRVAGQARPLVAAPARLGRRADQPGGLDVVPQTHRRRSAAPSSTPGGRPRRARSCSRRCPARCPTKPGSTGLPMFGVEPSPS
jgi:acetyl-CoA synthetase